MSVSVQGSSLAQYSGRLDGLSGDGAGRTINMIVGSGSNRLGLCIITKAGSSQGNIAAPTIDGVDMDLAGGWTSVGGGISAVYYKKEASLGGNGTKAIRCYTTIYSTMDVVFTVGCLNDVDQTTPIGTVVTDSSGTANSPRSAACSVTSGGICINAGCAQYPASITPAGSQILLDPNSTGPTDPGIGFVEHSYLADATAMGFSWPGGTAQVSNLIVPINPAAGGGSTGPALYYALMRQQAS